MAVEAHKHCPICGTPIPLSETFCSDKCQGVFQENQARVSRQRRILYILVIIFIVIWAYMIFF